MLPYWLLFLIPAFQALNATQVKVIKSGYKRWSYMWRFYFIFLFFMIGLRHEVGGDWLQYLYLLEVGKNLSFSESVIFSDPAFGTINWIAAQYNFGIYFVNSIFALIFTWGLLVFCRSQPLPWLALVVAVPYLITVVAMGYSRQGVAIGLIMLGIVSLNNKKSIKFLLFVGLAGIFHKSAIILLPLVALPVERRPFFTLFLLIVSAILLFSLLLLDHIDSLISNYITTEYNSSGSTVRVAMNALPAAIFLILRKRFGLDVGQRIFWTWVSCGAIMLCAVLLISPSSTAVDRMALYWIPLQLFVWSRFPIVIDPSGNRRLFWIIAIIIYSAFIYLTWMLFATQSHYWLPYQFLPWVLLWN